MKHTAVARLPMENPSRMKMASLMPMVTSHDPQTSPPSSPALSVVWFDGAVVFMARGFCVGTNRQGYMLVFFLLALLDVVLYPNKLRARVVHARLALQRVADGGSATRTAV